MASVPPGKDKIRWLVEYYEAELPSFSVEVVLGSEVTRRAVEKICPDSYLRRTSLWR